MGIKYVNAVFSEEQKENSLPVLDGVLGPSAIDIQTLYTRYGLLAYDPGFRSTASCKSSVSYVDGDKGVLLYRGYPIEELAERSTFIEVAYLLTHGELPSAEQLKAYKDLLDLHNLLHEQVLSFYRGFRRDGPQRAGRTCRRCPARSGPRPGGRIQPVRWRSCGSCCPRA